MQPSNWAALTLASTKAEQIKEFTKKFCGSFMLLKTNPNDTGTIVFIADGSGEDSMVCRINGEYTGFSNQGVPYDTKDGLLLEPIFPKCGSFTHNGHYYVSRRIPARQYSKSVHKENWQGVNVLRGLVTCTSGVDTLDYGNIATQNLLKSAIRPTFKPFYYELREFKSGYALNSNWGITKHTQEVKRVLWYNNLTVGTITGKDIKIYNPLMLQEVKDLLRDMHVEGNIV